MSKKSLLSILFLICSICLVIIIGCGGGDGGGTGAVIPANYAIYLEEDCDPPAPSSVTFQSTSQGSELATAEIVVTDVAGVYAASLYISFNADVVSVTVTEGDFLNSDGSDDTEFLVNSDTSGLLIIGISRMNVSSGIDAVGSETLLNLTFRHRNREGDTVLTFSNNYLLDSSTPPQEIPNVSWCSGSISVRRA